MNQMTTKDPKAFVTNEYLDEAVETIIKGMDGIANGLKTEMKSGFHQVNTRLDKIEAEITWVKDDVKGLTADL